MKKFLFFFLLLAASTTYGQMVNIDTVSFVKPGTAEILPDTSMTNNLEAFSNPDDAIIYIYRLSAMAGAAGKWLIQVEDKDVAKLKQKEFYVAHIDTKAKSHHITYPGMRYNYVGFKPNHYYMVMLKGFSMKTGYLDANSYKELKTCVKTAPLAD